MGTVEPWHKLSWWSHCLCQELQSFSLCWSQHPSDVSLGPFQPTLFSNCIKKNTDSTDPALRQEPGAGPSFEFCSSPVLWLGGSSCQLCQPSMGEIFLGISPASLLEVSQGGPGPSQRRAKSPNSRTRVWGHRKGKLGWSRILPCKTYL